ncbi:MAG: hypothetical protein ACJAR5_002511, partial [Pseudophaeobacter arcticus]
MPGCLGLGWDLPRGLMGAAGAEASVGGHHLAGEKINVVLCREFAVLTQI